MFVVAVVLPDHERKKITGVKLSMIPVNGISTVVAAAPRPVLKAPEKEYILFYR
jgi:hypothetical protein